MYCIYLRNFQKLKANVSILNLFQPSFGYFIMILLYSELMLSECTLLNLYFYNVCSLDIKPNIKVAVSNRFECTVEPL